MAPKISARPLLIGTLSSQSGVNVETIRYYERVGLLPVAARTGGGQRSYGSDHAQRLVFIRRSRELGFSLKEIQMLLKLHDEGLRMSCAPAKDITLQHLSNVRAKIASLKKLERVLSQVTKACQPGDRTPCPILHALAVPVKVRTENVVR